MTDIATTERVYSALGDSVRHNRVGEHFGLDAMREVLRRLGDPHHGLPVVHVAGSAGKGSTSRMIAELLTAAGLRVGLYTKPHLHSVAERFLVDGVPEGDEALLARAAQVGPSVVGVGASWFEVVTALALDHFKRSRTDIAVVESGIGGRDDATNVVESACSVITNVGDEHLDLLGGDVRSAAVHKAGIIRSGVPVVSGVTEPPARDVVRERAGALGAPLLERGRQIELSSVRGRGWAGSVFSVRLADEYLPDVELAALGAHQAANAALAITAARALVPDPGRLGSDVIRSALRSLQIPGRLERVLERPRVLLDAAHCAPEFAALAAAVRALDGAGRRSALIALSSSQTPARALAPLVGIFDRVTFCSYSGHTEFGEVRGRDPRELAAAFAALDPAALIDTDSDPVPSFDRVLMRSSDGDLLCVTGSFSLLAPVRAALGLTGVPA